MKQLVQAMPSTVAPEWPGGRWIGSLDLDILAGDSGVLLQQSAGYDRARLLVRDSHGVRGFIDVPIENEGVSRLSIDAEVLHLPPVEEARAAGILPSITVIVCTRDRAAHLRIALTAILQLDYDRFDVIVVDNASRTSETSDLLEREFNDDRITFVSEPVAGLSRARNAGLVRATGEIVAYTDDDVVVDISWLSELAAGFSRAPEVDCVSGLVPSGELRSRVQKYFDDRVSWSKNLTAQIYSLADPPANLPMFPFSIGEFGTGANFALRRSAAIELRGFDEAFGVGTPTGGGEDIDMFTRVILDGRTLVMHPAAIVWHRHRDDLTALRVQARGYGTGLGAWLTKLALNPRTLKMAAVRSAHALSRLVSLAWRSAEPATAVNGKRSAFEKEIARVGWLELISVARGPFVYALQRSRGASTLPKSALSEPILGRGK